MSISPKAVSVDPAEVPAGQVNVKASNTGDDSTDVTLVKADSAGDLDLVGGVEADLIFVEVENIPARSSCDVDVDLPAGRYFFVNEANLAKLTVAAL